jgi:hypothetical protein
VLHPWPYAGIERICDVWITDNAGHEGTWGLNGPQIRQLRQTQAVEDVVASNYTNQTVTGSDVPDDVVVDEMSGTHFQFLGLRPILGRYIMPTDVPEGQDPQPVAVLSYKFWQRHYRGDPAVVGKTIQLNHKTYTILGVMPVRFTWRDGDVYIPLKMTSDQTQRYGPEIKLKPGVSFEAAAAEFRPLYQEFDRQTPNIFPKQFKISVRGLAGLIPTISRTRCTCSSGLLRCCSRSGAATSRFFFSRAERPVNTSLLSALPWAPADSALCANS